MGAGAGAAHHSLHLSAQEPGAGMAGGDPHHLRVPRGELRRLRWGRRSPDRAHRRGKPDWAKGRKKKFTKIYMN